MNKEFKKNNVIMKDLLGNDIKINDMWHAPIEILGGLYMV